MKLKDITGIRMNTLPDKDLPYRVEIVTSGGMSAYGAAQSMDRALMRAFSVSGLWPDKQFPYRTKEDLQAFIFWNFDPTPVWLEVIKALGGEQ